MKKRNLAVLGLCGMLVCGGAAGGAYALYSGFSETTQNVFTIKAGKLNETDSAKIGVIVEDEWDAANATDLSPNQVVAKNPKFTSYAEYDAWCIMKVSIPTESMKVGGELDAEVYDIVTVDGLDTTNWTLLHKAKSVTDGKNSLYYYGYTKPLSKNESTTELFTAIKVPDISELTNNFTDSVDVSVFTVQAEGYDTVSSAFVTLGVI